MGLDGLKRNLFEYLAPYWGNYEIGVENLQIRWAWRVSAYPPKMTVVIQFVCEKIRP